ncbi:unnamed protein product [Lepeophtheirus salmonis]|uniref:(salmon louse) hypothetical protein n=1 Tax=Lepeophtheirus salmonis TaxID=72036 RepID=A0A7R8D3T5_LEPSM|nr:unnamed protein product [Lepeophtheirus salmonis]CAF3015048.1 unnamed protein product [Lepeophtheirus salmonis]
MVVLLRYKFSMLTRLGRFPSRLEIRTDASLSGYGGFCLRREMHSGSNIQEENQRNELQSEILLDPDKRKCGSRFPITPESGNLEFHAIASDFSGNHAFLVQTKMRLLRNQRMPPNR